MIILIDSGNSRLKIGWIYPNNEFFIRETQVLILEHFDSLKLKKFLLNLPKKPYQSFGVNVAGNYKEKILSKELENNECPIQWLYAQKKTLNLSNEYYNPQKLGPDRWLSMLGVLTHFPEKHPPIIVASFGTATTIDVVGPDKTFIGGIILPGIRMMKNSIIHGTSALPKDVKELFYRNEIVSFPKNTISGIVSGIVAAQIGALYRQWIFTKNRYQQIPKVCVTGGGWSEIEQGALEMLEGSSDLNESFKPIYMDRPILDGLALLVKRYIFNNFSEN